MADRYSRGALHKRVLELEKENAQKDGIINAMVAQQGRVVISQEDHECAQRGRVSVKADPVRGIVLEFHGTRPRGRLAKLFSIGGDGKSNGEQQG